MLMMAPSVAAWSPAYAACEPLAVVDVARMEVEAELALESLDSARLQALELALRGSLPCLGEPLAAEDAGRVHRLLGFGAYARSELAEAEGHFASARAADAAYLIPPVVLAETHPLRELYAAAEAEEGDARALPAAEGTLLVDGRLASVLPPGRPVVVQHVVDGKPTLTALVAASDPVPSYPRPSSDDPERVVRADLLATSVVYDAPPDAVGPVVYGGLSVGVTTAIGGDVVAMARGSVAWTPLREEWGAEPGGLPLAWTPHVAAGLGYQLAGTPVLVPGVQAVASATAEAGFLPGAAAVLDARVPVGSVDLAADVRVGWASGALVGLGAGVAF